MKSFPISELPGVGYTLTKKCELLKIINCANINEQNINFLKSNFGEKTGIMLRDYSLGYYYHHYCYFLNFFCYHYYCYYYIIRNR